MHPTNEDITAGDTHTVGGLSSSRPSDKPVNERTHAPSGANVNFMTSSSLHIQWCKPGVVSSESYLPGRHLKLSTICFVICLWHADTLNNNATCSYRYSWGFGSTSTSCLQFVLVTDYLTLCCLGEPREAITNYWGEKLDRNLALCGHLESRRVTMSFHHHQHVL